MVPNGLLARLAGRRPRAVGRAEASGARRRVSVGVLGLVVMLLVGLGTVGSAQAASTMAPSQGGPDFGPNVLVFDPSMPTSQIKAAVDAVAARQVDQADSEMGARRYALLFKPGTYGSTTAPLNFQVGYYTEVAGLGLSPTDVVINGSVNVYNRCSGSTCFALNNFWRSMSNLTINVTDPAGAGCYAGEFWAVSQAAPMRRVNVTGGNLTLMDYCTGPSFASGGFIADSKFTGGTVINGSQQQFLVRNSNLDGWTNGVWNQVFSGVAGAPAQCFPAATSCGGPYTTLATTPASREKPYLYVDARGAYQVFVPAAQRNSSGATWENGPTPGRSIPLSKFFVAKPSDSVQTINNQLGRGNNLLFTPGVYDIDRTISVKRDDTVVLGLGLSSLTAVKGATVMSVADVKGVDIAGLMIDAGTVNSPILMQIGKQHGNSHRSSAADPTALQDVFFRIGGPHAGKATVSLEVNSDDVILDDIWAWRADHGNPGTVGWTINTADTGVIVNGDNVTATGLFVEHYQKTETIWNGENGKVVFFQNELPYDPPSQSAWNRPSGAKGWPALKVTDKVSRFNGYGMGSYSFFNQGVDIFADNAFEVPAKLPTGSLKDLLTIFLDPATGKGGILNVINGTGGPSTIANPDVPVTVVSYP
ncbi:MAG: adenylyl cyclase [Kineosporiaceae bacterium]